jgi:hypothetical protein
VYVTDHEHSQRVCRAFARGARAPLVPPDRLQPEGDVAVYGRLRGCQEIVNAAVRDGRSFYYIDRGYFGASRDKDYSGYFRVTRDALQHSGRGRPAFDRLARLGVKVKPWRASGGHILVCPPGRMFGRISGFDSDQWTLEILRALRPVTDRDIVVRTKPEGPNIHRAPLREDLVDCHAVVTHSSNAAVEALIAGVPVFCTDPCAAFAMGTPDVSRIEAPAMPDGREEWAATLAANQWTLEEFESGLAWGMLNA